MRADDCKPGRKVLYSPSPAVWFEGVVASEPWRLSEGTLVCKLTDMEEAYGRFTHKTGDKATTVYAAVLERIEIDVAELEAEIERLRKNWLAEQKARTEAADLVEMYTAVKAKELEAENAKLREALGLAWPYVAAKATQVGTSLTIASIDRAREALARIDEVMQ